MLDTTQNTGQVRRSAGRATGSRSWLRPAHQQSRIVGQWLPPYFGTMCDLVSDDHPGGRSLFEEYSLESLLQICYQVLCIFDAN
jgi:hypothetical protein